MVTNNELDQALGHISNMVEFAYEQGYHEHGYDPVEVVRTELARRSTSGSDAEPSGKAEFLAHLKRTSDIVATWPSCKQSMHAPKASGSDETQSVKVDERDGFAEKVESYGAALAQQATTASASEWKFCSEAGVRCQCKAGEEICHRDSRAPAPSRDAASDAPAAKGVRHHALCERKGHNPLCAGCDAELVRDARVQKLESEIERYKRAGFSMSQTIHNITVGNQAAWIEWHHGDGAEAAMAWIHNGLVGPGLIPDEDEPHGKDAQAYADANSDHRTYDAAMSASQGKTEEAK